MVTVPEGELRELDPEIQGISWPLVDVGWGSEGGSEGANGKEAEVKKGNKHTKNRRDRRRKAAKRKTKDVSPPPLLIASSQGVRVEAQGQDGMCWSQSGFPARCEVATPHFEGQGGSVV